MRRRLSAVFPSGPPSKSWYVQVTTALSNIQNSVDHMHGKVNQILMSEQQIQADVSAISSMMDDVSSKAAELAATAQTLSQQAAQGQPVDTSALDALAQRATEVQTALDSAAGQVSALVQQPGQQPATGDVGGGTDTTATTDTSGQ